MLAGFISSEDLRENLFHISPLALGGLLAVSRIAWLVDALPSSLLSPSHGGLPVSLFTWCPFYKETSHIEFGTHPPPVQPHLNSVHQQ